MFPPQARAVFRRIPTLLPLFWFAVLLSSALTAAEVDVIWNRNPEPDIAGYRVRYSLTSGSDTATIITGTDPAATLSGLKPGAKYFCAVQAFNTSDLWSVYSDEISFVVPAAGKPRISISLAGGPEVESGGETTELGSAEIGAAPPTRKFTVSNTGKADLEGLRIVLTDAKNFLVETPPVSILAPGASADFTVAFDPAAVGNHMSALRIFSNDPKRKMFVIDLAGTAFRRSEIVLRRLPGAGGVVTSDQSGQMAPFPLPEPGFFALAGPPVPGSMVISLNPTVVPAEPAADPEVVSVRPRENPAAKAAGSAPQAALSILEQAKPASKAPEVTRGTVVVRGVKYRAIFIRQEPGKRIRPDRVQVSSDLIDWSGGKRHVVVVRDTARRLVVRDSVPTSAPGKRHIRLRPARRKSGVRRKLPDHAPPTGKAERPAGDGSASRGR